MSRRPLAYLVLLALAACQGERTISPTDSGQPGIAFAIQDANHGGGSPDFFWRPPMVTGGSQGTGQFNPNLSPSVSICATTGPAGPCAPSGYTNFPDVGVDGDNYRANWKVPKDPTVYYRVSVFVGSTLLGFGDVKTAAKEKDLNSTNRDQFAVAEDGSTLPIKFRIMSHCSARKEETGNHGGEHENEDERGARKGKCSEGFIDPTTGGTVYFTDGGNTVGGVFIPPQPGRTGGPITVNIQYCSNPANLPLDIPVFGSCLFVFAQDANGEIAGENGLSNAPLGSGEVFVCDAEVATNGLSAQQHEQVTLHRQHGSTIQALPHGNDQCPTVGGFSFKSLMGALAHRDWPTVRAQLVALVTPKPLYARRLDQGAGGTTPDFSSFQFALPAKMQMWSGNGQVADYGSTLPSPLVVRVTDLFGGTVANARVHFSTAQGSMSPLVVTTGLDGLAGSSWTFPNSGTPPFTATASGYGIASPNNSGPRGGDPFIPDFNPFDECGLSCSTAPVTVGTGTVDFCGTTSSASGACFIGDGPALTAVKASDLIVGTPAPQSPSAKPALAATGRAAVRSLKPVRPRQ